MPAEFIYSTYKLARHYPPDRTVLEDISISFYPGAKIGVIGPNGSGKSSLLRIMAGLDDGFVGEARLTPGFTVGYLEQEPQLDPTKNVKQNVLSGVGEVAGLIEQYNAVMAKWSDPDADYEAVGAEQAALEDRINAADAWNLERNVDIAMDALRCPPDDAEVSDAVRRREAARRALPAAPQPPRPAAPRRAHQPPRRRVRRLARAVPPGVQRHRRRDHPRPLLPGQRRAVDPRAGPRPGHPVQRQLLGLAGAEARPHGDREQAGRRPAADARPRARLGADEPQGPPVEGQGPPVGVRAAAGRRERRADRDPRARDRDPARPAAGRPGHRRPGPAQGLRRPAAGRGPDVQPAALGDRRDHRAQRRRQDDAVPDARGRGAARRAARSTSARRSSSRTSTRAATSWTRRRPCSRRSPTASRS